LLDDLVHARSPENSHHFVAGCTDGEVQLGHDVGRPEICMTRRQLLFSYLSKGSRLPPCWQRIL
jgi:hypothetical protein